MRARVVTLAPWLKAVAEDHYTQGLARAAMRGVALSRRVAVTGTRVVATGGESGVKIAFCADDENECTRSVVDHLKFRK